MVTYIVKQALKQTSKPSQMHTHTDIQIHKPYMRSKHGNMTKETILGVTKAESICDIDKGDMHKGLIHLIPKYG